MTKLVYFAVLLLFLITLSYGGTLDYCCYSICQSGVILNDICIPNEYSGNCTAGSYCHGSPPICNIGNCDVCGGCNGLGNCIALPCGITCGTGMVCDGNGVTSSSCVPKASGGGACSLSCQGMCASGVCCDDGKCKGVDNATLMRIGCCQDSNCAGSGSMSMCISERKTCLICGDDICDYPDETTVFCPQDCCEPDGTSTYGDICESKCGGMPACNTKPLGTKVCTDATGSAGTTHNATCCSGTPAPCQTGTTCVNGACVASSTCKCQADSLNASGQPCGTCYSTKPWYCTPTGLKVENCTACGCSGENQTQCTANCVAGFVGCDPKVGEVWAIIQPKSPTASCTKSCVNGNCYCNAECTYNASTCVSCGKNGTCPSSRCNALGEKCTYTLSSEPCIIGCNNAVCTYCLPTCAESCASCPTGQTCQNGQCVGSTTPTCNNNGTCDAGEDYTNCPVDCCGDGCTGRTTEIYSSTEGFVCHSECGAKCLNFRSVCDDQPLGSGRCSNSSGGSSGPLEHYVSCCNGEIQKCPDNLTCENLDAGAIICVGCSDGTCNAGENCQSCPQDCGCDSEKLCCNGVCSTTACTSDSSCTDSDPCTIDTCSNPNTCTASCVNTAMTCPPGKVCSNGACINSSSCSTDADCTVTGQKCCGSICKTPFCGSDSDCNDNDPTTNDTCANAGSCTANCSHVKTSLCGNGVCNGAWGETYCSCSKDCGVASCSGDVPGEICKEYKCSGTSCIEGSKENCCGNNKCESGEGCATCQHDCTCSGGFPCVNDRCLTKQLIKNGERCADSADCLSGYCNRGYCCAAGSCCGGDADCALGQVCMNYTCQTPGVKCTDETPSGDCSASKPKFCNNGNYVFACPTCGCAENEVCRMDGTCIKLQCSDGTSFGNCSNNKPWFCSEGVLISNCSMCGCPEGLLCDKNSETCYERPIITILSPHENETINVGVEKKVMVNGIISKMGKVNYSIEVNDSKFMLMSYNPSTGEFTFENTSPMSNEFSSVEIRVADDAGNLLTSGRRSFRVIDAPTGTKDLFSLQDISWGLVQLVLLLFFLAVLLNALMPFLRRMMMGKVIFPEGSIVLIEGAVGSGKEEFCLNIVRDTIGNDKFGAILSYEPKKEEGWFNESEKNKLIFVKVEPDMNEISWSISKALAASPKGAFFNILKLLIPKYNAEELTDFLSTNFKKIRDAGCTAVFCIDKGVDAKILQGIEGLFDGVVEFQVQEEKGKLSSYFRVKEFKLKKVDSNWRRFK